MKESGGRFPSLCLIDRMETLESNLGRIADRARLGHRSRNHRMNRILLQMLQGAHLSIPRMTAQRNQAKLLYDFMANPAFSLADLLNPYYKTTRERLVAYQRVLAIEDESVIDHTSHRQTSGMGMIGNGNGYGYTLHWTVLFAPEDHALVGLGDLRAFARTNWKRPAKRLQRYQLRAKKNKESELWIESIDRLLGNMHQPIAADDRSILTKNTRIILVADATADYFDRCYAAHHKGVGVLFHAVKDRITEDPEHTPIRLFDAIESLSIAGEHTFPRSKAHADAGSIAANEEDGMTMSIRFGPVTVRAPKDSPHRGKTLHLNVIQCHETRPLKKSAPIIWRLLTSEPVHTLDDAIRMVNDYQKRWLIEDLHKGLKTGCGLEQRQFEQNKSHEHWLAMSAIVACEIFRFRNISRIAGDRPAHQYIGRELLFLLKQKFNKLPEIETMTLKQAVSKIGELGGFMGSSKDHPGWQSLWHGYQSLLGMQQSLRLLRKLPEDLVVQLLRMSDEPPDN